MQMLYNSDSFAVMRFDIPAQPASNADPLAPDSPAPGRGGYEIVDKLARKEIFIEGLLAEHFKRGVEALVAQESDVDALDDFIAGFGALAQHPVRLH